MTKRSIFGQAFVAGIVLFSGGAEGSQIVISREDIRETVIPSEEIGGLSNQDLTQKRNEDSTGENERYRSSPRRYPVFYIDQSIWKTGQKSEAKQDEGILSWILRRLQDFGVDDDYDTGGNKPRQDDNLNNQNGYNNYNKVEVEEHKEKLITDDDGMFQSTLDDDPSTWTPPRPTLKPTIAPTPLDTTFWNNLDSLDTNMDWGDSKPTDTQLTDTDLLLNRPHNSVVLRIVLGVVHYENMTEVDITNIINMAARALNVVLNKDEEIPFVVYDTLDYLNRDGERNRDLGEAQLPSTPFRGEGKPQQRDATSPFDMADKYMAKLFLDNVVMQLLDNKWFEISSIYTVWRRVDGVSVKSRPVLKSIEGICSGSIERAMDRDIYWESLEDVRLGDPDLIIPGKIYYADDKGIVDAKDVGDEYDMADMLCPYNRPIHDEALECPKPDSGVTYSAVIADNVMEIEWGNREWFGFVLLCSTMLFVILLSLISDFVLKKRRMQQLWGAALTADGVDDFLQVGWQIYEKPPEEQPPEEVAPEEAQQQAQLYLHIYDKGKGEGYNDENSLLKGGVEPQLFAPSTDTDAPHGAALQPHQNPQESKADEDAADPNNPS